ncbi:MAG: HEPN domain-containing protein [Nitrososphaeria archaeon]|nr:HEPN domain-containing protein [Nitrososphaeria archaeon]MDW7986297.1 HEPN domain-containing protein [Nitrososphaerota archaeon]
MSLFKEFARSYLKEASRDLKRAEKMLEAEDYAGSIFFSQQCVEKAVKAMIEVKGEYVYNHGPKLTSFFLKTFQEDWRKEFDRILEALEKLQEYYTRSRYPFIIDEKVVEPSQYVTREKAEKAFKLAVDAFNEAKRYLENEGVKIGD